MSLNQYLFMRIIIMIVSLSLLLLLSGCCCSSKACSERYTAGRSDGIKQIYWNLQNQQRQPFSATTGGR